jgi:hypothetical protein
MQTRLTAGMFSRYKLKHTVYVKSSLCWNRISGADYLSSNPGRKGRNLSFRNDIFEASVAGQYVFYEINNLGKIYRNHNNLKVYVLAGAAVFYHNPKTHYNGEWVALQPLRTEGQGKNALKPYGRIQGAVPAGAGFFYTHKKKYRIGWEINWRTTFTDYLDDVSTTYPHPSALSSPLAAALSNRNDELDYSSDASLPPSENYSAGSKRGDPRHNDSYLSASIHASYVIRGKSIYIKEKLKNPYFKKKKYIYRIIRTKI